MTAKQSNDLLVAPDDATIERVIGEYARAVRDAYGDRLKSLFLFGSRARGDHHPESDVDIAVVLADDGWEFWQEKNRLSDLGYDLLIETGTDVQAWPLRESEWLDPALHHNPALVEEMREDARPVGFGP